MKAVVQRVKKTSLYCEGKLISEIEKGLAVYFGVKVGDTKDKADYLAKKIANLRVFEDGDGKMNLSVNDVKGEILAISQFTLLADTSRGNRPSFIEAEVPDKANDMYEYFVQKLKEFSVPVKKGVFGGDMKIEQLNDGPVTIIFDV